jgi:purine-cytosine permease-like protein
MAVKKASGYGSGLSVEQNGINVISESKRKGRPRDLFWPWCAANIAVLGIAYGSFLHRFGISFWQAIGAGVVGTLLSFLLVGFVSLAGKHGSAPTLALSRAPFGVHGNALPALVSWLFLSWQGYLLGPLGLGGRQGAWANANVGVIAALAAGFLGQFILARGLIRHQESVK